ncbi:hypothetical protein RFN58_19960 [Streptomyces iakyrus]|uniref:hypothetical protein n=1 Tax=Streptomyces iakyrus TaxID=68219 RepID=UPI0012FF1DC4|nr:hypothetical protein [Streptomyces iakyrus]
MADAQREAAVSVRHLRVSYVTARIHDKVDLELRRPAAFVSRLCDLQPISGLQVGLPFRVPVEKRDPAWQFWSHVAEKPKLRPPADFHDTATSRAQAEQLRKHLVPLRHEAGLEINVGDDVPEIVKSGLEVFLHPFGWTPLATVSLKWPQPIPVMDAIQALNALESHESAIVSLGGARRRVSLAAAVDVAADLLSDRLVTDEDDTGWSMDTAYRLATVIEGSPNSNPAMPEAGEALHLALNSLACGEEPPLPPQEALLPQYRKDSNRFAWSPTNLVFMLGCGTSVVLPEALSKHPHGLAESAAERHRRLALHLSYLAAATGLIRSIPATGGADDLRDWARHASFSLGRHFAPKPADTRFWGLETRAFLDKTDAQGDVQRLRKKPLNPLHGLPSEYP